MAAEEYVGKHVYVVIERNYTDLNARGFVVAESSELLLLRSCLNFRLDGFVAVRVEDIASIVPSPTFTRIALSENPRDEASRMPEICIDTMRTLLRELCLRRCNVEIECENCDDSDEAGFHIGRIVGLRRDRLWFNFFSSEGAWFDSPYDIPYSSVTRVEFGSDYIDTFARHIDDWPTPLMDPPVSHSHHDERGASSRP